MRVPTALTQMRRVRAQSPGHLAIHPSRVRCLARLLSSGMPEEPSYSTQRQPLPPKADSTFLFRATNPELQLDPSKSRNWIWPAGVVVFFAAYYVYLFSIGEFLPAEPPKRKDELPEGVIKVCFGTSSAHADVGRADSIASSPRAMLCRSFLMGAISTPMVV